MARPKGSKNKKNPVSNAGTLETVAAAKKNLGEEIDALTAAVEEAAQALKDKKAELKTAQKKLEKLEKQEAAAQEAAAQEAKRAEASRLLDAFLASGKSLDEVLEVLK